jgi:hypothetical protein
MSRTRTVYRSDPSTGEVFKFDVSEDYQRHAERVPLVTDRFMEGHTTADGIDIGSRVKRREYMNSRGLVETADCEGMWQKAARERAARGQGNPTEVREAIARAHHQLRKP